MYKSYKLKEQWAIYLEQTYVLVALSSRRIISQHVITTRVYI
jgi:hypothetical protein